jgi:hypothetical protein
MKGLPKVTVESGRSPHALVVLLAVCFVGACTTHRTTLPAIRATDTPVAALLGHLMRERPNHAAVACVEILRSTDGEWEDASRPLLSRLAADGFSVAPGSECAQRPYDQALTGSGWLHSPTGRTAEQYRVRVLIGDADSADMVVIETFSTHLSGCRYRVRRVGQGWDFQLLESPCASGDRTPDIPRAM